VELDFQEPDDRLELVADPDRVLQITLNLLSNAVKFSPSGGTVRLGALVENGEGTKPSDQEEMGRVGIWVKDEGPGIAAEDLERAWGEFQQVNPEDRERGAGIGLALSRQMAEYMGGSLTVDSEVGKGSRFTLWMPVGMERLERNGWIG
jgi:signal transduction histidine kinase